MKRVQGLGLRVKGLVHQLNPNPHTLHPQEAFTLIELLIAASILGVIGLTILTTFGSGFQVYERVQSYGGVQADVLLALEEMEKNIKNVFEHSLLAIKGDAHSIALPALIETLEEVDGEEKVTTSIGKITYTFDYQTQTLIRGEQNYSQAVKEAEAQDNQRQALATLDDLQYSYNYFDGEEESYLWQDSWVTGEKGSLVGVKIELAYRGSNGDARLTRTVLIPTDFGIVDEEEEEEEDDDDDEEGEGEEEGESEGEGEGEGEGGE